MTLGIKRALPALVLLGALLAQAPPFQILTTHLPVPRAHQAYHAQLRAEGGTPPYHWAITNSHLPPALHLNAGTGEISGTPASAQAFSVLVRVSDSATPPLVEHRLLPSSATAPLALRWVRAPAVAGDHVQGSIEVRNQAGESVVLTVIAVAVNQHGKAFALRYDHRTPATGEATPALAFNVLLPPGVYSVQVDAVAEVSQDIIYRQRLTAAGLTIPPK